MPAVAVAVILTAGASSASPHAVVVRYLHTTRAVDAATFQRDFPYDAYLAGRDIRDLARLERDRILIERNGRSGDTFLLNLFTRYLAHHPVDVTDRDAVAGLLDLSDRAIAFGVRDGARLPIYETVGYLLLDDLSERVEKAISTGLLVKGRPESQYVVRALVHRGYIVTFPTSRLEKLIRHIKANNWRYIADRVWKEMRSHPAFFASSVVLAGLTLSLWRFMRKRVRGSARAECANARASSTTTLALAMLAAAGGVCTVDAQTLSEQPSRQYYNGEMSIRRLFHGGVEIGSTVWLKRGSDRIKAKYFASGQVYQKYSAMNEQIILTCAGAFTERLGDALLPQGLTVDNGAIINRNLNAQMDGLVIVYATGGIAVSDIEREWLSVEEDGKRQQLDILQSADKTSFLNWAQRNKATVFQTQLLASAAGLRLDVARAQRELRERRLLAIVRDHRTKEVMHVVINVPRAFYLGPLTKLVYDYLRQTTEVVGLLNLDTGDYDVFQVNTPSGESLSDLRGPRSIGVATNLLVYYYARN